MSYKTRMMISYLSIAVTLSVLLGCVVYSIGSRYETKSRQNAVEISAQQVLSQMEDRLGRMDSIMNYLLSDSAVLSGIVILGMENQSIDGILLTEAEANVGSGLTTDYIIHNTYRTAFYNQNGRLMSSYVSALSNQRLNPEFSITQLPYLEEASKGKGKPVIVGAHEDIFGAYDHEMVYSLVKAIQGYQTGFLETENTIESLNDLNVPEDGTEYYIVINQGEMLFQSAPDLYTEEIAAVFQSMEDEESRITRNEIIACAYSELYDLRVYTLRPEGGREDEKALIMTAIIAALLVFTVGMIFVLAWSYVMSRPVEKLQRIVEDTNLDNLKTEDRRSFFTNEPEEFRVLSESYQEMTERLDQAVHKERRSSLLFLQAQFDTLQTQVNPHFIYNVLNIISGRGIMDDDTVISEMCGSLAQMLRYSTSNKERYATVEQELTYLDHYFYLIKQRYEERFEYTVTVEQEIHEELIPKMVLQQLVENSLSHGFENTDMQMKIVIHGEKTEAGWSITVKDNGEGIETQKLLEIQQKLAETKQKVMNLKDAVEVEIGGMGLINTYARCLLLFGDRAIFALHNDADGVSVTVGEMYD